MNQMIFFFLILNQFQRQLQYEQYDISCVELTAGQPAGGQPSSNLFDHDDAHPCQQNHDHQGQKGRLAQLVERALKNRVTRGSIPGTGTNTLLVPIVTGDTSSIVWVQVLTPLLTISPLSSGLLFIWQVLVDPSPLSGNGFRFHPCLELHLVGCFDTNNSQKLTF